MGILFFGLLPLPGLLSVTAFLFGLVIVLVIHGRRALPWRAVLVRAGAGLAVMWLAVTVASLRLFDRFANGGALEGDAAAGASADRLLATIVIATVLLLALAGGLLAWIAAASVRRRGHGSAHGGRA